MGFFKEIFEGIITDHPAAPIPQWENTHTIGAAKIKKVPIKIKKKQRDIKKIID